MSSRLYSCYDEVEMMKICDIERKEANFGSLKRGDVFEISGEIFMKASVELSTSELSGGLHGSWTTSKRR